MLYSCPAWCRHRCHPCNNEPCCIQPGSIYGILTICGMGMLMAHATSLGLIDMLAQFLQNGSFPEWLILVILITACAFLSFFVSGRALLTVFMAMIPAITAVTSLTPTAMLLCLNMGLICTSISPFSTGGAFGLTGVADEALRDKMMPKMMVMAVINWAVTCVLSLLGFLTCWG